MELATKLMWKRKPTDTGSGVYFVSNADQSLVKIGMADDIRNRWAQLRTSNPELQFLCFVESDRAGKLERFLHRAYDEYRHDGEWFWIRNALREFIEIIQIERYAREMVAELMFSDDEDRAWGGPVLFLRFFFSGCSLGTALTGFARACAADSGMEIQRQLRERCVG